jgi:hypothetical protein
MSYSDPYYFTIYASLTIATEALKEKRHWLFIEFIITAAIYFTKFSNQYLNFMPITWREYRSQWPRRLRHHSNSGVVSSNSTEGMDVYVRLFCVCVVLRVGSGLETE